jgi:hypothetical protein
MRLLGRGSPDRYRLFHVGFHGDRFLLKIVDRLLQASDYFVETGTNVGSTTAFVARTYPHITCYSCEPDPTAFRLAQENTADLPNVNVYPVTSHDFLALLEGFGRHLFGSVTTFWLDAHGYGFDWPLTAEVSFILDRFHAGYILIDDFQVPGRNQFAYHQDGAQICSFETIKDCIPSGFNYRLYYPDYDDHTSPHHTLVGWGLIAFGNVEYFQQTALHELMMATG